MYDPKTSSNFHTLQMPPYMETYLYNPETNDEQFTDLETEYLLERGGENDTNTEDLEIGHDDSGANCPFCGSTAKLNQMTKRNALLKFFIVSQFFILYGYWVCDLIRRKSVQGARLSSLGF